jgi:hypothetical protein
MKTKSDKVYKGFIFAGCSFTWGQGLNYYSNLSTLKEPGFGRYNSHLITKSQLKYLKSIRFPRLVANHFDTFEFVHKQNGRSNQEMISFWKEYFGEIQRSYLLDISDLDDKIYYDEISVLFFQVTQWGRNEIEFVQNGTKYKIPLGSLFFNENKSVLEKYLLEQNLTLGQLEIRELQKNIIMIKEFLEGIENKNIKTFIFTWPDENVKFILEDEWLKERFIKFEYNNSEYNSIQTLLQKNTELSIMNDYENFITPPKDDHPSKKCHEIIANKLIEKLKNYENKNR